MSAVLDAFAAAGALAPADVHVARALGRMAREEDDAVLLAAALAVRAPRLGHVLVDLATARETTAVEGDEPVDVGALPWPASDGWPARVEASELVAAGDDADAAARPLRLLGTRLYLDRYWRAERRLAADLRALAERDAAPAGPHARADAAAPPDAPTPPAGPASADLALLADGIGRLFPGATGGRQALAAATAVLRPLAIVAGGPGTGKTTTVARIAALVAEQAAAAGDRLPLVALAAPTGKAAARLAEAVHDEAPDLAVAEPIRAWLTGLESATLHRLLGRRPGSHSRFRHGRDERLPHDLVIVDETSMVSLWLMGRLVEAVRPGARLVLVGDPGQLTSIEAGAVLGDVVGPAADGPRLSATARGRLAQATGADVAATEPPPGATVADGIVVLDRVHRFGAGIASVAEAIRRGDAARLLELLADPPEEVAWLPIDPEGPGADTALAPIRAAAVAAAEAVTTAARAGEAGVALEALGAFRLLCAHRRGPQGVAGWTARIEGWLGAAGEDRWYAGRPLLVTRNDYELGLFNGDTGVVVQASGDGATAVFERGGRLVEHSPERLDAVDTVYAMTIHKSQGSAFDTAAVLLPAPGSRILTRELLYTAATRARRRLILAGSEEALRAAVERPAARASGLGERLWGAER